MQRFAASSPYRYATDSCGLQEGSMKTALIILITSKKGQAKGPNKFFDLLVSATCLAFELCVPVMGLCMTYA